MPKVKWFHYILILAAVNLLIYFNIFPNEFVSDDLPGIINNPNLGKGTDLFNPGFFLKSLNHWFYGSNPAGYHLTSLVLHIIASVLVLFFLRRFFSLRASFWGSLIFAVHPIHGEAVAWISGMPYILMAIFLLAAFLFYSWATVSKPLKKIGLMAAMIFYLLAASVSIFSLAFPVFLILYDLVFTKWRKNQVWRWWLTFFGLTIIRILLIIGLANQRIAQLAIEGTSVALSNPLFNMAHSVFEGLRLLFWPAKLTLYHESAGLNGFRLGAEVLFLLILLGILPLIWKRLPTIFLAVVLFVLFLAPTYSPITVSWLTAERYLYFPSIALSMTVALVVEKSFRRANLKPFLLPILISIALIFSLRTVARNLDWRTADTLWIATAKASPLSPKAHNNMGDVYYRQRNLVQAATEFNRAIELKPDYADGYHNLANTYQNMGRIEEAIANYQKAVKFNPYLWQSYQNLGAIYFQLGEQELSREYLNKASKIRGQRE